MSSFAMLATFIATVIFMLGCLAVIDDYCNDVLDGMLTFLMIAFYSVLYGAAVTLVLSLTA